MATKSRRELAREIEELSKRVVSNEGHIATLQDQAREEKQVMRIAIRNLTEEIKNRVRKKGEGGSPPGS